MQAHRVLALDYLYTNQFNKACVEFQKGVELSHDDPIARAYLARCYALSHRQAEARRIRDDLVKASVERYISASEIAAVYAALNDDGASLEWLNKACSERAGSLILPECRPCVRPLAPRSPLPTDRHVCASRSGGRRESD